MGWDRRNLLVKFDFKKGYLVKGSSSKTKSHPSNKGSDIGQRAKKRVQRANSVSTESKQSSSTRPSFGQNDEPSFAPDNFEFTAPLGLQKYETKESGVDSDMKNLRYW